MAHLKPAHMKLIWQLATRPNTLAEDHALYAQVVPHVLSEGEYVETVAIVAALAQLDMYACALGRPLTRLPSAGSGSAGASASTGGDGRVNETAIVTADNADAAPGRVLALGQPVERTPLARVPTVAFADATERDTLLAYLGKGRRPKRPKARSLWRSPNALRALSAAPPDHLTLVAITTAMYLDDLRPIEQPGGRAVSRAQTELLAAHVSSRNGCAYGAAWHGMLLAAHTGDGVAECLSIVDAAAVLTEFADAACEGLAAPADAGGGDATAEDGGGADVSARLASARAALKKRLGAQALIDAAAVVGMCHGANCVADACGVRIDGLGVPFAAHVLAELKMGAPPPSWRVSGAMRWASGRFGWFALRMMHAVAVMRPRQ